MLKNYLEKNPLLFDGAMGTYLMEKFPQKVEEKCERYNLTHPEWVQAVHREYLQAGAVAIKTNTFAANKQMLNTNFDKVAQIIRSGWQIANEAVQEVEGERFVFADIGPIPVKEGNNIFAAYQEVVDLFIGCGARYFLFETLESGEAMEDIASYIKKRVPDSFIMISFGTSPEGFTRGGFLAKNLFLQMQQSEDIDAVGFNCISGPKHLLELVKKLPLEQVKKYITIMPNAGYPTMLGNRIYYGNSQNYFGKMVYEMLENGVSIVGGCCGTTPKDIEEMRGLLENKPIVPKKNREVLENESVSTGEIQGYANSKNEFAGKLRNGEKVIVVELDPPLEPDIDFFMEGAARYQKAGVDAIDIADCPIAKARIDSSILACKVSRELGLTTIPHMTCRDRNINATKALLLGLNVEQVNNVLTVTGDPLPAEMRGQVKTVFSYNSAVLARHIHSLNQEVFQRNPFMVSGALNINAVNFDSQISHARKKIESGVSVLFTQPVLSKRGYENLKRARRELPVKILGGIIPVVSYRNACFMNNEMAGIEVQPDIIDLYKEKNRQEGEELAYQISTKIADAIEEYVDGYYIITPFKRVDLILRILEYIKKK